MQDRTNTTNRISGLVLVIACLCLVRASNGQTCKTNLAVEDPATKRVCATWDELGEPVLDTDLTVSYGCTGGSDAPRGSSLLPAAAARLWPGRSTAR